MEQASRAGADRQRRPARVFDGNGIARVASGAVTSVLVLAALHGLFSLGAGRPVRQDHVIEAVLLTPRPPAIPALPPAARTAPAAPAATKPRDSKPPPASMRDSPRAAAIDATTPAAGPVSRRLDYGALLGSGDAIAYAERAPGQRDAYRTPFESRPNRFRMRRKVTPEDVVRGFAQLVGLWPPGYTDSPCPAIRGLIAGMPEAPSPRELEMLRDAVMAREQFCS